jgi:hypothetical protein
MLLAKTKFFICVVTATVSPTHNVVGGGKAVTSLMVTFWRTGAPPTFQQVPPPTALQAKAYELLNLLPVAGN